jgi:D-alanyl-D-alanine dipeptidase
MKHLLTIFALLSVFSLSSEELPEGFVDLSDIDTTILLDMRYYTVHNFVGDTIDGYHCPRCILTKKAALAVASVQEELLKYGLSLKVYDCYRPQRAVDHFVRWAKDLDDTLTKREFYPTVEKKNLFKDGFIAEKSSHSRGSTIDLTIVSLPPAEQEEFQPGMELHECTNDSTERFGDNSVDMGTGFDCFDKLSHSENPDLSDQQRARRLLLRTLMEKYGFRHYEFEWWHYTYGDEPFKNTYFDFPIECK